jgi:hypothetical protein
MNPEKFRSKNSREDRYINESAEFCNNYKSTRESYADTVDEGIIGINENTPYDSMYIMIPGIARKG